MVVNGHIGDDARCHLRHLAGCGHSARAFCYAVIMAQRSRDHRAAAGLNPAQGPPVATYQTRVSGYVGLDREAGDAALAAYAELVRPGGAQAVCRCSGGPIGSAAEERLHA